MCEFEDGTDLLRLMEGTTFLWILSGNGSGRERAVQFFSKDVIIQKTQTKALLYPPALGTIPIGYWVSRALGPSSKACDGIRLYTLGGPYSRLNQKLHVKR